MAKTGLSQGNFKRIFLLILLLGTVFLGSYIGNNNINTERSKTNYKIETPNIKNKNLAQFYLWTKEDPIFTSPNLDSDSFYKIIVALKKEEKSYLKLINKKDKIFPTDFLLSMVSVSKAHDAFIKDPTPAKAQELIAEYKNTVRFYKNDISNFNHVINSLDFDTFDKTNIVLFDTTADKDTILNDLTKLRSNADKLEEEINKRQNCFENGSDCKRPALESSSFKIADNIYSFSNNDILPKDLAEPIPGFLEKGIWSGPYAVSTACLGWSDKLEPVPHLYYLINITEHESYEIDRASVEELYVKLATTNYYENISSHDNLDDNNWNNPLGRRIVLESNAYNCLSSEYRSKLASIDYLYRNYKDKQVFGSLLSKNDLTSQQKTFFEKGRGLENAFFESEFPSDIAAKNLANYYELLYKNIITWRGDPQLKDKAWIRELFDKRDEFLNRALEYKTGLSSIDKVFSQARDSFASMRTRFLLGNYKVNSQILYLTYVIRSLYGLSYLPFSPAVYRLNDDLSYFPRTKIDSVVGYDKKYITYQEALNYYPKEVIESWRGDTRIETEKKYKEYLLGRKKSIKN